MDGEPFAELMESLCVNEATGFNLCTRFTLFLGTATSCHQQAHSTDLSYPFNL